MPRHTKIVDEHFTSQTCAKCFARFNRRTKKHRFKICPHCHANEAALLPGMIVSKMSNRQLRKAREQKREEIQQQQQQDVNQPRDAVNPTRQ